MCYVAQNPAHSGARHSCAAPRTPPPPSLLKSPRQLCPVRRTIEAVYMHPHVVKNPTSAFRTSDTCFMADLREMRCRRFHPVHTHLPAYRLELLPLNFKIASRVGSPILRYMYHFGFSHSHATRFEVGPVRALQFMSLEHKGRRKHKDTQATDLKHKVKVEDMIKHFFVLSDIQLDTRCMEWKTIRNREGLYVVSIFGNKNGMALMMLSRLPVAKR
ncbi:hypothetical protein B0H13DRAFT_1880620 [Mycena leptocephala]|nr:hypothetical protein B0H13DRAFT_1880620 [Mycena leptocephala]